jgi:hypothetical protein
MCTKTFPNISIFEIRFLFCLEYKISDILVLAFLAFSGIFDHYSAFCGILWRFWELFGIFGLFLAFLALNATFGIEDILFLPVSRPLVVINNWYFSCREI